MKLRKLTSFLSFLVVFSLGCQTQAVPEPPPPPIEPADAFSQAELDQMLAPIALYPDALLSQVLMASTYPLEVVEASRWSRELNLDGEEAVDAAQEMNWDISIKALVAFPDLIQLMDDQLTWTRKLGDAFLLQEEQVMETIQMLRRRSLDEGNLDSLDHLVIRQEEEVIIVEPREVEVVYVPYYNTRYVYGDWWWYDYPPIYWNFSHHHYNHFGFYWGTGFRISTRFYFSFCDWHHRDILLHHYRWNHGRHHKPSRNDLRYGHGDRPGGFSHGDRPVRPGGRDTVANNPNIPSKEEMEDIKVWNHNPQHRRGVEYRGDTLNTKLQRSSASGLTSAKLPARTAGSRRSVMKPPTLPKSSSSVTSGNSSQRTLPTTNRRYQTPASTANSSQVTRSTSGRTTNRITVPSSSSRNRSAIPSSRSTVTSSRQPTLSTRPSTSSRSSTVTRPSTIPTRPSSSSSIGSSSSRTVTRPPVSSRSSSSQMSSRSSRSTSRPPAAASSSRSTSRPPAASQSRSSSSSSSSRSSSSGSSSRSYSGGSSGSSNSGSTSSRSMSSSSRSSGRSGGSIPNSDR